MANDPAPTPQPAQPDPGARVIQLRHDLRNPLGHIMGFAELLLEAARKKSCTPALEDLAFLCRESEAMIPRINLSLDPHNVASGLTDLARLLQEIERFCAAIQAATSRLGPVLQTWADPVVQADLDRITESAQRLQAVAAARLPGLQSAGTPPSRVPGPDQGAADVSPEGLAGIDRSVLGCFLPRFVVERLKQNQDSTAECFPRGDSVGGNPAWLRAGSGHHGGASATSAFAPSICPL